MEVSAQELWPSRQKPPFAPLTGKLSGGYRFSRLYPFQASDTLYLATECGPVKKKMTKNYLSFLIITDMLT